MIKISETEVLGFEAALRGMRNPLNSWSKSDSFYCAKATDEQCENCKLSAYPYNCKHADFILGNADYTLMKTLFKAGVDHRKYLRMFIVYITDRTFCIMNCFYKI